MFALANAPQAGGLQSKQADAQTTYNHIPANMEALVCSDPEQQADCKIYFAGFAHTLDLIFATDSKGDAGDGLCGDISDLIYEFAHEVQTNPKARTEETHTVLATLLIRDHNCSKRKGQSRIQNHVSAGELIDMCHAGDIAFSSCSQYQAGFLSAVLFVSEQTGKPVLCGDQRLINPLSVSTMLNDRLQANFRLRRDPAVAVMLDELKANMPCSSK
ncbi:hypothetical protein [Tunturibacter empetritectus]|uniref:Rap1a immunity protein domain-containing protein n=1 Tax=Tunturiibacter empetritectus TaxID=3069691 RepID=A0A7W8IET0_9BACT|nr:hypothetical protein [Edaphobacter lichenicola]MBB5315879.1 hypothetical protein [Edaphobacter lichenicola]